MVVPALFSLPKAHLISLLTGSALARSKRKARPSDRPATMAGAIFSAVAERVQPAHRPASRRCSRDRRDVPAEYGHDCRQQFRLSKEMRNGQRPEAEQSGA